MRRRSLVLASVVSCVLCVSCSSATAPATGNVDQLTIAVPSGQGPLNIFVQNDEQLTYLVYDKLVEPSAWVPDPRPGLAESVREVDPLTWDVTVRDGIRWQDGQPFTVDDVAFTIDYFKKAPTGRWTHHISEVPTISAVAPAGPRTLRISCAFACPYLGSITLADLPIIPKHVWQGVTDPNTRDGLPVGTGPYRLVSFQADQGYRFEANTDYFGGIPRVSRLNMPIIKDPSTTFTALRTGEIDAAVRPVPPELVNQFRTTSGIALQSYPPLGFPQLVLNYQRAPFDNPAVRHALNLGIDRRQLLDTVWLSQGKPADRGYAYPDSPWTDPTLRSPYDPVAARAALDEAGVRDRNGDGVRRTPDGKPIAFSVTVAGTEPTQIRAAELLADQFRGLGLRATVQRVDAGAVTGLNTSRDFDTYVNTIGAHGVADPTQFFMSHLSG
ncbi:MAG: ABC transporter substrate-binding protein, partial [Candidatus Dormibacteria bacterium]